MKNKWYVLTGGPATGKTSVINALKRSGHQVVTEAARDLIDEAKLKGQPADDLRKNEKQFQIDVFRRKQITEASLEASETVFFDRGIHDTLAYFEYYKYAVPSWIKDACLDAKYNKVFVFEPLPKHIKDYARVEPASFSTALNRLLAQIYSDAGIETVTVPFMSIDDRYKFILSQTKSK